MNIIFWYIRDEKLNEIGKFIVLFTNFFSSITKIDLFSDISTINKKYLKENVNLNLNKLPQITENLNNKKINIFFFEEIIKQLEIDNILIVLLNLEKINENYFFKNLKEIKKSKYNKFLFLPFFHKDINPITKTVGINFLYENIFKKNILEPINIDIDISHKKLEKILKKIREI